MENKKENIKKKQALLYELNNIVVFALLILLFYYLYLNTDTENLSGKWEVLKSNLFFYAGGLFFLYQIYKSIDRLLGGETEKSSENFREEFGLDIFSFQKVKQKPLYSIPFIIALAVNMAITYYLFHKTSNQELGGHIIGYFFLLIFFYISIFSLAFMLTGEILQRENKLAKNSIILDMLKDIVHAVPYVLILVLAGFLFLLINDKDKKIKILGSFGLFTALKYFTYINLTNIAYSDQSAHTSWKNSLKFIKQNAGELAYIFFTSGQTFSIFLLGGINLFVWNKKFHWLSTENSLWISGSIILLVLSISLFIEQLSFLFYYSNKVSDNKNQLTE